MYNYNKKYFTNYVENLKYIECEEESKDVPHTGFRTDNENINDNEMSTFWWFI